MVVAFVELEFKAGKYCLASKGIVFASESNAVEIDFVRIMIGSWLIKTWVEVLD